MAQTDTRPTFRLPWSPEKGDADEVGPDAASEAGTLPVPAQADTETPTTPQGGASVNPFPTSSVPPTPIPAAAPARRPTKFMVELSRAMQVTAESSRDETLARFSGEAKTVVEEIHASSTVEAAALRRRADDDVAAVREWSKAEIARIREEAEARIAMRKTGLDGEMDAHALVVEARVERVGATVARFEAQMAVFFERLLAEEDPTRIATMAETMPDPPDLAEVVASITEPEVVPFDPVPSGVADRALPAPGPASDAIASLGLSAALSQADAGDIRASLVPSGPVPSEPDFAAAEAEAAAFTGDIDEDDATETAPPITEHAGTAAPSAGERASGERVTTRVVVVGLISVASIASFKRSLGRAPGVSSIGVASGPDGEFVFTVVHDSVIGLADAVSALPGFEARIYAQAPGQLEVAAHDPDAGD